MILVTWFILGKKKKKLTFFDMDKVCSSRSNIATTLFKGEAEAAAFLVYDLYNFT
jgi:hypothetical protein